MRQYGGMYEVRDLGLLSSALYMPQSAYGEVYLHQTIPSMAAAYAYHICQNHPFADGNKGAALASALVFLDINGYDFVCSLDMLYEEMMAIAKGERKKDEAIRFFEKYGIKRY